MTAKEARARTEAANLESFKPLIDETIQSVYKLADIACSNGKFETTYSFIGENRHKIISHVLKRLRDDGYQLEFAGNFDYIIKW